MEMRIPQPMWHPFLPHKIKLPTGGVPAHHTAPVEAQENAQSRIVLTQSYH